MNYEIDSLEYTGVRWEGVVLKWKKDTCRCSARRYKFTVFSDIKPKLEDIKKALNI